MAKTPKKKSTPGQKTIALNKQARHEFYIEQTYEAGMVLQGWEIKSLREGRVQLKESYVILEKGEVFLFGAHISALLSASTHIIPESTRTRKLLLHGNEIFKINVAVDRKGYAVVPLAMYWKNNRVKLEIGLGKGKQQHDKRDTEKARDWGREKDRIMKRH
ncbi:SsrA-binding protein SmpB [Thiothrix litoralis]|jgi:SsrA-binding protein|uniref:SsrA-binding protein n=2 Tax=Thiothrix TaxID=1030 RepID=A0ABY9MQA9_9GAMM|nr:MULTISPECIES: SsrA-binding protein SmpB [Thiothrix]QTR47043.1 SsrA-binding protein SmpB [Thiothrix litoralis]WML90360.1 SsrA-binding protein SmpB [Thiothrix lacustris]WMP17997.1 SsrA-binding protein SmpB [Thiothrix lacustris]